MTVVDTLWAGWAQLSGTVLKTVGIYALALVECRLAGRRTLAQFSGFDVLITVAVGSVIAGVALPVSPSLADGGAVITVLVLLQALIAALRQRFTAVQKAVDFAPRVLVRNGRLQQGRSPSSPQLTESDVHSILRRHGVTEVTGVVLAVMEPSGKVSLLTEGKRQSDLFGEVAGRLDPKSSAGDPAD